MHLPAVVLVSVGTTNDVPDLEEEACAPQVPFRFQLHLSLEASLCPACLQDYLQRIQINMSVLRSGGITTP